MTEISIPNQWTPRPYQLEALQAFDAGKRRQYHIWHRRAGKDSFTMNLAAREATTVVGTYWIIYPTKEQARQDVWYGIGKDGIRFIDKAFPEAIRKRISNQEMLIELFNGSIIQLKGADKDKLVGANTLGIIFSEWALADPASYDYLRPIIRQNKGWVIFITTFRGKNHAYTMFNNLKSNAEWYVSLKTIKDTGVFSEKDIDLDRAEGYSEALIQQEYYCSPMAAFEGSYYIKYLTKAIEENRVAPIDWNPLLPVRCAMDLGFSDHCACIFYQIHGDAINIIGSRSYQFTEMVDILLDWKTFPWTVKDVVVPHDYAKYELVSISKVFNQAGYNVLHAPNIDRQPGIELVRQLLSRNLRIDNAIRPWCKADAEAGMHTNNAVLLESIAGYRTEPAKDKTKGVFSLTPAHTWESHLADALRYLAVYQINNKPVTARKPDLSWRQKTII